jgi:hypothetical protein
LASIREWYAAALKVAWRHEKSDAAVRDILIEDHMVAQLE